MALAATGYRTALQRHVGWPPRRFAYRPRSRWLPASRRYRLGEIAW